MIKFYGTMICPNTVDADKVLRKNGLNVEYIDIISSMKNMKEFLALRDKRSEFDKIKEAGKAGVPVFLLEDGSIEFDVYNLDGVEKEENFNEEKFLGCSIDGSGSC